MLLRMVSLGNYPPGGHLPVPAGGKRRPIRLTLAETASSKGSANEPPAVLCLGCSGSCSPFYPVLLVEGLVSGRAAFCSQPAVPVRS